MPDALDPAAFSVDGLDQAWRDRLAASADLLYFAKDAVVAAGAEIAHELRCVVSGTVQERHGTEVVGTFGPGAIFDAKAMLCAPPDTAFVAAEDCVIRAVPAETVLEAADGDLRFGTWLRRAATSRLRAAGARQGDRALSSFMMARIRQTYIHPAVFVGPSCTAHEAAVMMRETHATSLLVQDGERVGILTDHDLRDACLVEGRPTDTPVGPLATYDLVALEADDFLFNALLAMNRHGIRRVVVRDGGDVLGILEQVDLLGFMSNQSHLMAIRIERAQDEVELREAADGMGGLIQALHANGVKVPFIAELVTQLNRRIFRRLWEMLAPPDLVENSCLVVMGSEGRGEQILKTDQDNGLILRDGFEFPGLAEVTGAFTRVLIEMGYPECPGGIMVRNPEWSRALQGYKDSIFDWIHHPSEAALLNLAIFYDAEPVTGDEALLAAAKGYLMDRIRDNAGFFGNFAKQALSFDTPIGMFQTLKGEELDIKKGGIFPLVHGVRSLALEKRLTENNTFDRIRRLEGLGALDATTATELSEALSVMIGLRLRVRLATGQIGTQTDNLIRPDALNRMERDLLRDALSIVKNFKALVSHHFHLGNF